MSAYDDFEKLVKDRKAWEKQQQMDILYKKLKETLDRPNRGLRLATMERMK